jgi:nucleoside-diphosphate-sugar epimerase
VSERFLVTGAYGCIGAWTVHHLIREGVDVIGVDAGVDDRRVRDLLAADELAAARFVQADISDPAQVENVFGLEPTHVIHLAALQVPDCRANPVLGAEVNVVGTVALFAAATAAGLRTPVVYASSVAAFAELDGDGRAPAEPSGHPATHYGVFKTANEEGARVFWRESGVSSIGLRPHVVYGPGRDRGLTSAPTEAMRAAAEARPYTIPFAGRCEMQYAPDVAAAFIAAARASHDGATVVNVPGTSVSIDTIVAEIERAAPHTQGLIEVAGDPLPFPVELDSSAFAAVVGPLTLTPLSVGIAETIEHFRRLA